MKKLILSTVFVLYVFITYAQVTLDKKYDYSTSVVKLKTEGYKYYLMDVPNAQCRIYNLDHSLFKTINCNVPTDFYLADINYISEKVFDDDSGIELVCTYYKYVPVGDSYYYEYDSKIINEDGSLIQEIDGGRYIYIVQTDEDIYKVFAYCYDYSVFPEKVWTNIYNLPESAVYSAFLNDNSPGILLDAFPNPASETVKVVYNLPENIASGKLHLIDNNGRLLEQFLIDNHSDHLALDVSSFVSGVYHYFIEYGNTKTESKKLVIQ
ncbi:T9SS type A sorting domain-containing protein [Draconibacterium sp.]|nr:T9SS type A sorting domain-containing protein [Draconibacterium sp.]